MQRLVKKLSSVTVYQRRVLRQKESERRKRQHIAENVQEHGLYAHLVPIDQKAPDLAEKHEIIGILRPHVGTSPHLLGKKQKVCQQNQI